MDDFVSWVQGLGEEREFVAAPLAFDGFWIEYYLRRFTSYAVCQGPYESPRLFTGPGKCLTSYAAGVTGADPFGFTQHSLPKEWFGDVPHTHRAIDDARGYAHLLVEVIGRALLPGHGSSAIAATVPRMATHWTLGGTAVDPQRQAAFWAAALGYVLEEGFEGPEVSSIVDPDDVGPAIGWLRTTEPGQASNPLHIDIRVAGKGPWDMVRRAELIRAKVPELEALGARYVREEDYSDDEGRTILGHVVMLDPEGHEFCVA